MIHEAIDAAFTLGWALLAWIVLTAVVATAALYAVVAVAWWVARTVWALLGSGAASGRSPVGPSWRRGRIRARIYVARSVRGSGGLLWLSARRVLGTPLLHGGLGPDGRTPDLLGLGEVGDPVDEVVDALPVDAEACRDLVGREVAGDLHVSTVAPLSSPPTASIGVVELLEFRSCAPMPMPKPKASPICKAADCSELVKRNRDGRGMGYCDEHWGDRLARQRRPGDRYLAKHGYVMVKTSDGRIVGEHRLVMERHLGRKLSRGETVHHINGVRDDNRIENLELWFAPQPYGQRVEDLLRYAVAYHRDALATLLSGHEQPPSVPESPEPAGRRSEPRISPAPSWAHTDTEEAA